MSSTFTLREMRPEDGPALVRLMENDPPSQDMSMTTRFLIDAYQSWIALKPDMAGVVAEAPGFDGLAGSATVSFEDVQFEGRVLPGATLENLKVDHAFRGQGLGTELARRRIEKARERVRDGVIATATSTDNSASLATMKKWAREFRGPFSVAAFPMLGQQPQVSPGLTFRTPEPADYAAIVDKANRFYAAYNLYPPLSAEKLSVFLATTPAAYHYRVAVDGRGNILAGALLTERSRLMVDEFHNVPPPIRAMNILPPNDQMRLLEINLIWFDQPATARQLWEMIRWEFRDRASNVSTAFDQRGPLRDVFPDPPAYMPKIELMVAVAGPTEMNPDRLIAPTPRG